MSKNKSIFSNPYFKNNDYCTTLLCSNEINFNLLNIKEFNNKYKIYRIQYSRITDNDERKYYYKNIIPKISSKLFKNKDIVSIAFDNRLSVYVLLESNTNFDWDKLFDEIDSSDKNSNKFSYKKISIDLSDIDVKDKMQYLDRKREASCKQNKSISAAEKDSRGKLDIVYRLLFNALAKSRTETTILDGQLYIYIYLKNERDLDVIRTLNVSVKDELLKFKVVTFSLFDRSKPFLIEKYKNKQKYFVRLGQHDTIKIEPCFNWSETDEDVYVMASDKKATVNFDNIKLNHPNETTKLDILINLIDDFNREYEGIVKLDFMDREAMYQRIEAATSKKTHNKLNKDHKILNKVNVFLSDAIDENSDSLEKFLEILYDYNSELDISISNKVDISCPNICIIHDAEYYSKNKLPDIKNSFAKDLLHQCITIEALEKKDVNKNRTYTYLNAILRKCLSELLIKREVYNRFIDNWKFGACKFYLGLKITKDNNSDKKEYESIHCMMNIDAAGNFSITEDKKEIGERYTNYLATLKDAGNICLVEKDGNLNEIEHTEYLVMPKKEKIDSLISESMSDGIKYKHKTNKYFKEKNYYPYVDKIVFIINGYFYYTIGYPRGDVNTTVFNLNNSYRINPLPDGNGDDSEIILDILGMLKNYHIRGNNTESVRPYPFKHILEYLRMKHPDIKEKIRF